MPLFIAAFIGALISAAGTIVGQILISLLVGFVTYTGVSDFLAILKSDCLAQFQNLPPMVSQGLGMLKVDVDISMLFSALTARLVLNGLTNGSIKKMVFKSQ